MKASRAMGSFAIVAMLLLIGVAMISDITSQSGIENEAAPLHSTSSIATMLGSGLGMAVIAVFILGFAIVLNVLIIFKELIIW